MLLKRTGDRKCSDCYSTHPALPTITGRSEVGSFFFSAGLPAVIGYLVAFLPAFVSRGAPVPIEALILSFGLFVIAAIIGLYGVRLIYIDELRDDYQDAAARFTNGRYQQPDTSSR